MEDVAGVIERSGGGLLGFTSCTGVRGMFQSYSRASLAARGDVSIRNRVHVFWLQGMLGMPSAGCPSLVDRDSAHKTSILSPPQH